MLAIRRFVLGFWHPAFSTLWRAACGEAALTGLKRAEQGEAGGLFDLDVEQLACEAGGIAVENDDFVVGGAAGKPRRVVLRRAFAKDLLASANFGGVAGDREAINDGEELLVALLFHGFIELAGHFCGRGVATF